MRRARSGRSIAQIRHIHGFISPLDLVEIGLISAEEAGELHAIETAGSSRSPA